MAGEFGAWTDGPGFVAKVFCTQCGQKLAVPTTDLRATYRCPRCQAVHAIADLVPSGRTVPGVLHDRVFRYEHAAIPDRVSAPDTLVDEMPPDTLPMPTTARMPGAPPLPGGPATPAGAAQPGPLPVVPIAPPAAPAAMLASARPPYAAPMPAPAAVPAHNMAAVVGAAAQFGQRGFKTAGVITRGFVRVAGKVDAKAHGYRQVLIGLASLHLVVAGFVDDSWYDVAVALFGALLLVLLLGRVAACRDDDTGQFSWRVAGHRAMSAMRVSAAAISAFVAAGPFEQLRQAGWACLFLGVVGLAVRSPLLTIVRQFYDSQPEFDASDWSIIAIWLPVLGGLLVATGFVLHALRATKRRKATSPRSQASAEPASAASDAWQLPPVVDVFEGLGGISGLRSDDRVLVRLIAALGTWSTRQHHYEDDYRRSLVRHLRNVVPDLDLDIERPVVTDDGVLGYLDIAVGNSVAFELKPRLTASTAQRAVGQVWQYARSWKGGPVILVVCETEPRFKSSFVAEQIRALRAQGHAVMAVAAGIRWN